MQQVTIHSPGKIRSSQSPRKLTTAPATQRMRIKSKNFDRKEKSTCLSLGGKIKATVFEITHVDSVDPEPGFGYGWSCKCKGLLMKDNGIMDIVKSATSDDDRSGGFLCSCN